MKNTFKKGFTLIELLVVIAIIGILASVVLASLGSARNKGKDASVKSQLASIRAQAELYVSANNNQYADADGVAITCSAGESVFDPTRTDNVSVLIAGIANAGGIPACFADTTAWAVSSSLPSDPTASFWCVDSTGTAMAKGSQISASTCQ
ncbi:MAG: type II secretion system protein [Candidatus Paceibacterota bacterium]